MEPALDPACRTVPPVYEYVWILSGVRKSNAADEILAVSSDLDKLQAPATYYHSTHRNLTTKHIHVLP
jgi:hypothetical protein